MSELRCADEKCGLPMNAPRERATRLCCYMTWRRHVRAHGLTVYQAGTRQWATLRMLGQHRGLADVVWGPTEAAMAPYYRDAAVPVWTEVVLNAVAREVEQRRLGAGFAATFTHELYALVAGTPELQAAAIACETLALGSGCDLILRARVDRIWSGR